MIKISLVVHNTRNETITVSINNCQYRYLGTFYVDAKIKKSSSVEDTDEGSDYFEAYDLSGNLLKNRCRHRNLFQLRWVGRLRGVILLPIG